MDESSTKDNFRPRLSSGLPSNLLKLLHRRWKRWEGSRFLGFFVGDSANHEDDECLAGQSFVSAAWAEWIAHLVKLSLGKLLKDSAVEPRLVLQQNILDVLSEHRVQESLSVGHRADVAEQVTLALTFAGILKQRIDIGKLLLLDREIVPEQSFELSYFLQVFISHRVQHHKP